VTATPYADAALVYLDQGWFAIPVVEKTLPEKGTTGKNGVVTPEKIRAMVQSRPDSNLAIRHEGTLAIDVDAYAPKVGAKTLELRQQQWGKLPATWTSTARGATAPSRQYFFRVDPELEFEQGAGEDIDVVQHTHRYSVVWPSVHPKTGAEYRWYRPDGSLADGPPTLAELPFLPTEWVEGLRRRERVLEFAEKYDFERLSTSDRLRSKVYTEQAQKKILAELDRLTELAKEDIGNYRGPAWETTVFRSATKLIRLANSGWSTLSQEEAYQLLFDHSPRDSGFGDEDIDKKWESAQHTVGSDYSPVPWETEEVSRLPEDFAEKWDSLLRSQDRVDISRLLEALKTYCARIEPQWEKRQLEPTVAETFTKCRNLRSLVKTSDDADKWLEATKHAMSIALGATS
jgi:hypothetical protein